MQEILARRACELERRGIDKRDGDARDRRGREGQPAPSVRENALDREDGDHNQAEEIPAMQVRPQEEERQQHQKAPREPGTSREEQIQKRREQRQREELRPVGPRDLRYEQRRDDQGQADPPRGQAAAREANQKQGAHGDERGPQDRDAGPASGRERGREGDLAEPLADAEVRPGDRRREDVQTEELAMVEHPPSGRELPVSIRVGRRKTYRDDEDGARDREGIRVRGEDR